MLSYLIGHGLTDPELGLRYCFSFLLPFALLPVVLHRQGLGRFIYGISLVPGPLRDCQLHKAMFPAVPSAPGTQQTLGSVQLNSRKHSAGTLVEAG